MPKLIFVNLPVRDLPASIAFYEALGATKDKRFSDATAACMVVSETIHVMLLTHTKYRQFTPKEIADTNKDSAVLFCVSADSRDEVDDLLRRAGEAGGRVDSAPPHDLGFMYGRSFDDPDGHGWQFMWMDLAAAEAACSGAQASTA